MRNLAGSCISSPVSTAFLLALAVSPAAPAAVLNVCKSGCVHSTIQSAVDAATSGDQIYIDTGLYTENVVIVGKTLSLDGKGSGLTVVDGSGAAKPVFTLGSPALISGSHHVRLRNLTITHGNAHSPDNIVIEGSGGGIRVQGEVGLILDTSTVIGNSAQFLGGGVFLRTTTGPASTIINSRIEGNRLSTGPIYANTGGGIEVWANVTVAISGSTIRENAAYGDGSGIYGEQLSHLTITTSTISDNAPLLFTGPGGIGESQGGGIATYSDISISDCSIYNNTAVFGGGVFIGVRGTNQSIKNTTIVRNTAGLGQNDSSVQYGGGLYAQSFSAGPPATLALDRVYVSQNTSASSHVTDNVATSTFEYVKVELTDSTIGDPKTSECMGSCSH
jgi:Right handed beta helix region